MASSERRKSMTVNDFTEEEQAAFQGMITYQFDSPDAFRIFAAALLAGAPLNDSYSPTHQLMVLCKSAAHRPATARRAASGKPLPKCVYEGDQEYVARQKCQKVARTLIIPKGLSAYSPTERRRSLVPSTESGDMFIRRLDAHREAPEALIAPQSKTEDDMLFIKRMVAVKASVDNPNILICPKEAVESVAEFEARLKLAQKHAGLVLPRGAHESAGQFTKRLLAQERTLKVLLPPSADEPEATVVERHKVQLKCDFSVHPFDASREDVPSYWRRLQAQASSPFTNIAPGDTAAITKLIGAPAKPEVVAMPKEEVQAPLDSPTSVQASNGALDENSENSEAEASPAKPVTAQTTAPEPAVEPTVERVMEVATPAKTAAEVEVEASGAPTAGVERIAINKVTFIGLKKLLQERGVPKEEVSVANKMALKMVADKWADVLKVEWYEDWA